MICRKAGRVIAESTSSMGSCLKEAASTPCYHKFAACRISSFAGYKFIEHELPRKNSGWSSVLSSGIVHTIYLTELFIATW